MTSTPLLLLDSHFQTLYSFSSLKDPFLQSSLSSSRPCIFSIKQSIIHVKLFPDVKLLAKNMESPKHSDSLSPLQMQPMQLYVHLYLKDLRNREKWEHVKMRLRELMALVTRDQKRCGTKGKQHGGDELFANTSLFQNVNVTLEVYYVEGFANVKRRRDVVSNSRSDLDNWDTHEEESDASDEDESYTSLEELESDVCNETNEHSTSTIIALSLDFHRYTSNTVRIGKSLFLMPLVQSIQSPFLEMPQYEEFLRSPPMVQNNVKRISRQISDYLHENRMNCKASLFALGTFSRWIGEEMQREYLNAEHSSSTEHSPEHQQKRSSSKSSFASTFTGAGLSGIMKTADALTHGSRKMDSPAQSPLQVTTLILVDRLLDLVPCAAHSSHFVDRMTATLKPVNSNPFDMEVVESSMLECFPEKTKSKSSKKSTFLRYFSNVRYASFSPQGDEQATQLLDYLLTHSYTDSVVRLGETLQNLLRDASGDGKAPISVEKSTPEDTVLSLYHQLYKEHPLFCVKRHKMFEFLAVCVEALRNSSLNTDHKKLMSLEHLIVQQATDDSLDLDMPTSILEMILDQIKKTTALDDVISLLTLTYSLFPPGTKFLCENEIKILLVKEKSYKLTMEQVEILFQKLTRLNQQRSHFKNYRSILNAEDTHKDLVTGTMTGYHSVFRQLAHQIYQNSLGSDLVHCNAESMTGFISGSLSRFMFSSGDGPPIVPENCENLVVFCVGGISGADVAEFEEHVQQIREKFPRLHRIEYGSTVLGSRRQVSTIMMG